MADFEILGYTLRFSPETMRWYEMYLKNIELANEAKKGVETAYYVADMSTIQGIRALESSVKKEVVKSFDFYVDFLKQKKIYYITHDELWKTCRSNYENTCVSVYNDIENDYFRIMERKEDEREYREYRKDSRSRMVGYGFGIGGALKASAKAGMYNAASGAAHSMVNAIGNMKTSASASSKLRKLNRNPMIQKELENAVEECIRSNLSYILKVISRVTNIRFEPLTNEAIRQSKGILEEIKSGNVSNDEITRQLVELLGIYPRNLQAYEYIIEHYGDRDGSITKMANTFGYSLEEEKKKYVTDKFKADLELKFTIDQEAELSKIIQKIKAYCDCISLDSSLVLAEQEKQWEVFDKELRTVNGHEYPTREEADKHREVNKRFAADIQAEDIQAKYSLGREKELLDKIKEIDDYCQKLGISSEVHVKELKKRWTVIDKELRTVNGHEFKTRELADKNRLVIQEFGYRMQTVYTAENEKDLLELIDQVKARCSELVIDANFFLPQLYEQLSRVDKEIRTVRGVTYSTREEALPLREDLKMMNDFFKNCDFDSEDLLNEKTIEKYLSQIRSLKFKSKRSNEICKDVLNEYIQPFIDKQTIKRDLSDSKNFFANFYKIITNTKCYQKYPSRIKGNGFVIKKLNANHLDGTVLINVDLSENGNWKNGFIFTTRCFYYYRHWRIDTIIQLDEIACLKDVEAGIIVKPNKFGVKELRLEREWGRKYPEIYQEFVTCLNNILITVKENVRQIEAETAGPSKVIESLPEAQKGAFKRFYGKDVRDFFANLSNYCYPRNKIAIITCLILIGICILPYGLADVEGSFVSDYKILTGVTQSYLIAPIILIIAIKKRSSLRRKKIICGISILLMAYTIYIMFFSKTYLWKEWYFGFYGNFFFGLVLVISSIEAIRRDLENS